MKRDLQLALKHIKIAQPCLLRSLSKRYWPFIHEDVDHLIQAINDCLDAIRKGEQLPP